MEKVAFFIWRIGEMWERGEISANLYDNRLISQNIKKLIQLNKEINANLKCRGNKHFYSRITLGKQVLISRGISKPQ